MKTETIGLIFRKIRIPNAFQNGLVLSFLVFKLFDVEGRVKRAMDPKSYK